MDCGQLVWIMIKKYLLKNGFLIVLFLSVTAVAIIYWFNFLYPIQLRGGSYERSLFCGSAVSHLIGMTFWALLFSCRVIYTIIDFRREKK